ncbi:PaaI family thioesterase [Szabonella alba]|uniref:Medium/long-chain acyl-CoA thioesterase YigI n=1 Tax=Szabonella alba TaxID=2804194 RepID=A0A8K0VAV1_9RHOB|nr:PaaI family thioesterase [Szabonella alba]MBL4915867.1 PaaI family thioesterase [Szabonella alba]
MSDRIRQSFAAQSLMETLQARITALEPGRVEITAPILPGGRQQQGAGHAGVTFALADTAAGFAALSLMPEDREVMTVEAKINLLAPALGEALIARGRVVKAGRRLSVVTAEVFARAGERETCIAILQGTMIPVDGGPR